MGDRTRELLDYAKDQLRAAILFGSRNAALRAMEALDEIDEPLIPPSAFEALKGSCEFCPSDGGGCGVCGAWN